MLALVLTSALLFQAAPVAQPSTTAQRAPAKQDVDDPDRIVCRREHVIGSNRPQRVCRTARDWADIRDAARDAARNSERGAPAPLPSSF